jgi:hypothetical protein
MPHRSSTTARILAALVTTFALLAGSMFAASPARADDPIPGLPPIQRVAELNAPYQRCGYVTCTVYLDRSTAKHFADRLDEAYLGHERVTGVGSELLCAVFGGRIGFACGLLQELVGTSFLDAVQQAEDIDGCVTFKHARGSGILATHHIGSTNSQYCRD